MSDLQVPVETPAPVEASAADLINAGRMRTLAKRVADGRLRPREQADLARVAEIVRLEQQGLSGTEIAARLPMRLFEYKHFVKTMKFRVFAAHCYAAGDKLDQQDAAEQQTARRREMRARWDRHDQDALDYAKFAFLRHVRPNKAKGHKVGDFVDPDRAERAFKMVAQAQGWLEPIPQQQKPKELAAGVIQAQMQAMRATDKREMVVRVTETTTTVTEMAARETAAERKGEEIG